MQFDPSLRGFSVPHYENAASAPVVFKSSESRIYTAICRFFLGCTAVSGLAFFATFSPVAIVASLAFGLITLSLYFPKMMTSSSSNVHHIARHHFPPSSSTTYVYSDPSPTTVFVERPREERRRNRNLFEIPQDAFYPSNPPVTVAEQLQERHTVGEQRGAPTRPPVTVEDLQSRHKVGAQRVAPPAPPRQTPPLRTVVEPARYNYQPDPVVQLQSRHTVGSQRVAPPEPPRQAPPPRTVVEPARAAYRPDPVARGEERHLVGGQRAAPTPQAPKSQQDAEERHTVGKG